MKQEIQVAERSIITVRRFPYAIQKVWRQWSEAKLIEKWFGPDGFTTTSERFEFREGGFWTFVMHGPDGAHYPNEVQFVAIDQLRLIRYTHLGGSHFDTTVEFAEVAGGHTEITFTQVFNSKEERDRIAVFAEPGNQQFMNKLESVLRDVTGTSPTRG